MKARILCGLLIGTLALAGNAAGATYSDAATNYPGGSWTNGSNGGTGFKPWSIVADGGAGGWAGAGIWDSTGAGLMMGEAFGFVGKVGYIDIDRAFNQALNTNDTFEFDFGVNWDSNGGNKGFNLYANGIQVVNVNHGSFPGALTFNGVDALTNYGTNTMHWIFTQLAPNQIGVSATGRDGAETFATTVTTDAAYGYVGSLRFYSSGLANENEDRRQSYFDNLTLTQEGTPPPEPVSLAFTAGTYDPSAGGDYEYTLERSGAVGDEIVLSSTDTDVLTVPASVSFEASSNTVIITATVVSVTSGPATILASNVASGAWAEYIVTPVAPSLTIGGPWQVSALGPLEYTLTRAGAVGDLITLQSSDTGVLTVPADLLYGAGVLETTFPATAVGYGSATITASNAASGAVATYNVTVQLPALTLTGPAEVWTGSTPTYTVTRQGAVGDTVYLNSTEPGIMTVPATVDFPFEQNSVTFQGSAVAAGATVLTAINDDAMAVPLGVTVADRPEYDAYDDASLYAGGTWELAPAHVSGFSDWTETLAPDPAPANVFRGRFIGTSAISAINEGGVAFGLYANWGSGGPAPDPLPEVKVSRSFPAAMTTGQTFSVDVGYDWTGGTKGFKLKGDFEGTAYTRFELFNSGDSWSYKLNDDDATITVIWAGYIGGFVGRVQATCTAPNTFTFSFLRTGDAEPQLVENVGLPGSIDQVEFYSYDGGEGDEQNFYFNRMWLTKSSAPEPAPDFGEDLIVVGGQPVFTVPAGYTLGTVYGADNELVAGGWNWKPLEIGTDYTVAGNVVTLLTDVNKRQVIRIGLNRI